MSIDVQGTVAPGFESVRTEFAAVVAADNGESGAQPAAFVHDTPVVDLWAGPQVTGDTLTGLLSATKGAATVAVPLLVQEGRLKLDQPVAAYWPEFAERGKAGITLRQFTTIQTDGRDLVRGDHTPYSVGFEAKGLIYPFLGAQAFGHTGAAGSDGFADPHTGLSYGYTRRRAAFGFQAGENERLAAVLHRAVRNLSR